LDFVEVGFHNSVISGPVSHSSLAYQISTESDDAQLIYWWFS